MEYNDDYATCERTYAALRIYPGDFTPDFVTETLEVNPSRLQKSEEALPGKTKLNAWFLSTKGILTSRDSRRHIDWITDQLMGKEDALKSLQEKGVAMDISCFWLSTSGHGGPCLSPEQMRRLAQLNLEIWWDIYFEDTEIKPV